MNLADAQTSSVDKPLRAVPGINAPLLVRIGVTGHKTFALHSPIQGEKYRDQARRVEQRLSRMIKLVIDYVDFVLTHTDRIYQIISPLAEGGDIIITQAILTHLDKLGDRRHELHVLLPMPQSDYLGEFNSEEYKSAYGNLIRRATKVEVLVDRVATKADKSRAYEKVTQEVARSCDILIAAWDEQPTNKPAGTAATVEEALEHGKTVFSLFSPRSNTPGFRKYWTGIMDAIARAVPPKMAKSRLAPACLRTCGVRLLKGHDSSVESLKHLDQFNRDLQKQIWTRSSPLYLNDPDKIRVEIRHSYARICLSLTDHPAMEYFATTYEKSLKDVFLPIWRKTAGLAKRYQKLYNWTVGTSTYVLAALAVTTVAAAISFAPTAYPLYWLEVFEAFLILLILGLAWQFDWHRKRIEYRLLSEYLRAAIYLYIAGVQPSPHSVPAYLQTGEETDAWITYLFNNLTKHIRHQTVWPPRYFDPLKDFIIGTWLEDQAVYYRSQAHKQHSRYKKMEIAGLCTFILTMIIAVLHALGVGHDYHSLTSCLNLLSLSLPAIGGAIGGILAHREYRRNSQRYSRVERALRGLISQAREAQDLESLQAMLQSAHELMLREQQAWHFSIGIEPPKPT